MKTSSVPAIAAFPGSAVPRLVVAPPPRDPDDDEVLCRTLQLGICGTDRDILQSQAPALPVGESHLLLGHECLARVEAVGANVTDLQVGDLVTPAVRRPVSGQAERVDMFPFGETFVERGIFREHGFSAPRWLDRPEYLHRVPETLREIAVFAEPMAVVEKAINESLAVQRGRLGADIWTHPPPRMLVTGIGPIAFAAVAAARARDWQVTMLGRDDKDSARAKLVAAFGADYRRTKDAWQPRQLERDGFDLILECTADDALMMAAAEALRGCGILVWLGAPSAPAPAMHDVARLMREMLIKNQIILGSVNAAPRDFRDALTHLAVLQQEYSAALANLITARVTPADAIPHLTARVPGSVKTVLCYE